MSKKEEILTELEKEKKEALIKQDIEKLTELNKLIGLLRTEGGIVKRPNPYSEFFSQCITKKLEESGKEKHELGEVQRFVSECGKEWNSLSEEEKEKYRKKGVLDIINLP